MDARKKLAHKIVNMSKRIEGKFVDLPCVRIRNAAKKETNGTIELTVNFILSLKKSNHFHSRDRQQRQAVDVGEKSVSSG